MNAIENVEPVSPSPRTDAADATAQRRPRVAVVFGGRSSEHPVSCATAAGVIAAIDRDRYDVVPVGITRQGQWVLVDRAEDFVLEAGNLPEVESSDSTVVPPMSLAHRGLQVLRPESVPEVLGDVDVVFPLLHGPYGEDGTFQGLLELSDTRYVGAGVFASALSMDKHYMKVVLEAAGLAVGPYEVVTDRQWRGDREAVRARVAALGFPLFVKPARAGSSIGISKVDDLSALDAAMEEAREHDKKLVIEAGLVGREVECGVLGGFGDASPETSVLGEIVMKADGEFYDFEAKYLDESRVELVYPADLPAEVTADVRDVAARTFEAVGCEGLARVDVFVTEGGRVVVNEINTLPGFTPYSMFPRLWQASGLEYPELVDRLIRLALQRPVGLR